MNRSRVQAASRMIALGAVLIWTSPARAEGAAAPASAATPAAPATTASPASGVPSALPALPAPANPSTDPMPTLVPTREPAKNSEATKSEPHLDKASNAETNKNATSGAVHPTARFVLAGGYDWHSYDGIPFRGFQVEAGAEAEFPHFGLYGALGVTLSESSAGLGLVKISAIVGAEYVLGRFRVGLEASTAYLNIQRVTTPGDNFEVSTEGLAGQMSFDILRFEPRGAIFLRAKIAGDIYSGGDTGVGSAWGPTFLAGFRY